MAGFVVVLDANVLYGIEVTDLFATMAVQRIFRPHWSPQILDEVRRNLAKRHDLDPAVRLAYQQRHASNASSTDGYWSWRSGSLAKISETARS